MDVVGARVGGAAAGRGRPLGKLVVPKERARKGHKVGRGARHNEQFLAEVQQRRAMLERQDSTGEIKPEEALTDRTLARQGSQSLEFFSKPSLTLMDDLRRKFDPTGRGAKESPALYSDTALLRRESLKYDPMVIKTLEKLWLVIDVNNNDVMDKEEYKEFHSKLALVLIPSVSYRRSLELCADDWDRDTDGGVRKITRTVFGESMFELADRWTDEISAPDYIRFLEGTFQALSEVDPTGRRVYKSNKTLLANRLTQAPLSRLHAMSLQEARARAAFEERCRARAYREGRDFDVEAFEREWESRRELKNFGSSASKLQGLRSGSKRHIDRSTTGLSSGAAVDVHESDLPRRRTLDGPPRGRRGSRDSAHSGHNNKSNRAAASPASKPQGKSRPKPAGGGAGRFYPPPKSWWARHARCKSGTDDAAGAGMTHSQLVLGPNGHERIGVVLFDPVDDARLHRLVISARTLLVEQSDTLALDDALKPAQLGPHQPPGVVQVRSPARDEAAQPEFLHAIFRSDWIRFCGAVDNAMGRVTEPQDMLRFVGMCSSYNVETGVLGSNFHFTAADVAANCSGLGPRSPMGLADPSLQARIAKFIVLRLRRALSGEVAHPGRGAAAGAAAAESAGMRRCFSSSQLLESMKRAAPEEPESPGFMNSLTNRFSPRAHEALGTVLDTKQREAFQRAEDFGLYKRHSFNGGLTDQEHADKHAVLVSRGRAQLAQHGGRELLLQALDSPPRELVVPSVVSPELPAIRLVRNYHKIL